MLFIAPCLPLVQPVLVGSREGGRGYDSSLIPNWQAALVQPPWLWDGLAVMQRPMGAIGGAASDSVER